MDLLAKLPAVPENRRQLAKTHINLGNLLADLGKLDFSLRAEVEAQYQAAIKILEGLAADSPSVPEYRRDLAASHNNLGVLLDDLGKRSEAETEYRSAMALREKLAADFPAVPGYRVELGGSYCNFGSLVRDRGRPADSLAWYSRAIATLAPLVEKEPLLVEARQALCYTHWGRAEAYGLLGRHAEGVSDWDRAIAAGYRDTDHLAKDADLEPLRQREDFRKLFAELKAKPTAAAPPKPGK